MTCGILRRLRHDARPVRGMAREDAKIPDHVEARRRHCSAKTHQQIFRLQHEADAAVLPLLLEAQEERIVITAGEPLLCDWRARDVPRQPLYLFSVDTIDPLLAVQIDPTNLCDRLVGQGLTLRLLLDISEHEPKLRLPCPVATDANSECGGVVADSQSRMLQLHLGWLRVGFIAIETTPVLFEDRIDTVSDAASDVFCFSTRGWRQSVKRELAVMVIRVLPNVNTVQAQNMEVCVESDRGVDSLGDPKNQGLPSFHACSTQSRRVGTCCRTRRGTGQSCQRLRRARRAKDNCDLVPFNLGSCGLR